MRINQRLLTNVASVLRSPRTTTSGDKSFFESIVYEKPMKIARKVSEKVKGVTSTAGENAQEASKSEDYQKEWDDAKEGMERIVKKSKHQYLNAARDSAYEKTTKDSAAKETRDKEANNTASNTNTEAAARDDDKNPPRPDLTNQPK